jgi:hypothetical protein
VKATLLHSYCTRLNSLRRKNALTKQVGSRILTYLQIMADCAYSEQRGASLYGFSSQNELILGSNPALVDARKDMMSSWINTSAALAVSLPLRRW